MRNSVCNYGNCHETCNFLGPIAVALRSEAWVCGRSLAEIMGSNPAGGMNVHLL